MNDYGYFLYKDIAVEVDDITYTANVQSQYDFTALGYNDFSADEFQSFQLNDYITAYPKALYNNENIGFLSTVASDENGEFTVNPIITATFNQYASGSGVTIYTSNTHLKVKVRAYQDTTLKKEVEYEKDVENVVFFSLLYDECNKIEVEVEKCEVGHFASVQIMQIGRLIIFGEDKFLSAEITNNFSIKNDELPYDILELEIPKIENADYMFLTKQIIVYSKSKQDFYIETVAEDEISYKITAYDYIAQLEDDFYGGIYNNYSVEILLREISINITLSQNVIDKTFSGYIPITTKRDALQLVIEGCGLSLQRYTDGNYFIYRVSLLGENAKNYTFDNTNIVNKSIPSKVPKINNLTFTKHFYTLDTSQNSELYNWYLAQSVQQIIKFSNAYNNLTFYYVSGIDEDGNEILTPCVVGTDYTTISSLTNQNYVAITYYRTEKLVIKGVPYNETTINYNKKAIINSSNVNYDSMEITDCTISADGQTLANYYFDLYRRNKTVSIQSIQYARCGDIATIGDESFYIIKKINNLNGVYEYELA